MALSTDQGRRFAEVAGQLQEAVVVGPNEIGQMIVAGSEGVYAVGTGNVGVAATFLILGLGYSAVMLVAAFSYRLPAEGWQPEHWSPPSADQATSAMITRHHVEPNTALKTPQFYLVWIVLCLNVTAGIGVIGIAKTMIGEIFGTTLPDIVDTGFAATYVLMISVFNMGGRFFWASLSDKIGRQRTYTIFFVLGILLYLSIPLTAMRVSAAPNAVWLVCFYAATMIIFTMYGGGFATVPAYLADLFGARFVGGIHGRLLTAWSTAGVLGPVAITWLRERTRQTAIRDLAEVVNDQDFKLTFGAPVSELPTLLEAKTVTIEKLLEIAPAGTVNPTASLYNSTMFLMAGLLALALVANLQIRPVNARYHLHD